MMSREKIIGILKSGEVSFATVSGIVSTSPDMIKRIDSEIPEISVITTKSYQVRPSAGNREPVVAEPGPGSFGNAVGLRNPGMVRGLEDLEKLREKHPLSSLLNVSVSGNSIEEFTELVRCFEKVADLIELNLSCPHAADGYGMAIGRDPGIVYRYVSSLRKITDALLFPKLTPNVESISEIALAAVEGGADGISAVNTFGPELYTEPRSGKPVLTFAPGNRGGLSGRSIKEAALEKVAEIRRAVGPDLPVIGMGGIETGKDVAAMRAAGADIVGLGSVFASVHPEYWKDFFSSLKADTVSETDTASVYRDSRRKMEYMPFRIRSIRDFPGNVRVFELDGKIDFEPGEFAFLWLPGAGEKPFSIVKADPLTFIIRQRGLFTEALMRLTEGDFLFVRGSYGSASPETSSSSVFIAAGGTGIAVAAGLALRLSAQGKTLSIFAGNRDEGEMPFRDDLEKTGEVVAIADSGKPGRVLDVLENRGEITGSSALYTIGPPAFMLRAAGIFTGKGVPPENIFISVETPTLCGVGLCGGCSCGGKLTCREGTFFTLKYLNDNGVDIMEDHYILNTGEPV